MLAGLSVFFLCLTASREGAEQQQRRWLLMILAFAARTFEMSGSCVSWVSTAEIFTTDVRSTGHATANAVARVSAFFAPYLVEGETPILHVGVVMLLIHAFTVACVCGLPETKGKDIGAASSAVVVHQQATVVHDQQNNGLVIGGSNNEGGSCDNAPEDIQNIIT